MSTFTTNIDATAERQGLAELWMASNDLAPYETQRHVLLGMQAAEAEERRLPVPPAARYCWQRSCEAHDRLSRAPWSFLVWGPVPSKKVPSTNDKQRRAEKFLRRARLLLEMRKMPGSRTIDLTTATLLSGIGLRTLHRACEDGRLIATKSYAPVGRRPGGCKGQWLTTISSVRDYLHAKLNGPQKRRKPTRALTAA